MIENLALIKLINGCSLTCNPGVSKITSLSVEGLDVGFSNIRCNEINFVSLKINKIGE